MANIEKWLSEHSLSILFLVFILAVIAAGVVVCYYPFHFSNFPLATQQDAIASFGQFGDFFGGTLNPIFGFLSVMALLAALVIQGRELKVSSEELRNSALALNAQNKAISHQSFEQTFFSWLENYGNMLSSIDIVERSGVERSGRNALNRAWSSSFSMVSLAYVAKKYHEEIGINDYGEIDSKAFEKVVKNSPKVLTDAAIESWGDLYSSNEYQLDGLFRNLYRLLLWIDSQNDTRMSSAQKWLYVSIVRAQLSWIEMGYLFYNGYTERGAKFRRVAEKYALFDNLNFDSDSVMAHVRKYPPENMCYADTAFDSRLARKTLGLPESTEETLAIAVV